MLHASQYTDIGIKIALHISDSAPHILRNTGYTVPANTACLGEKTFCPRDYGP